MPVLQDIAVTADAMMTNTSNQNNESIEAISNILHQTATILLNTTELSLQDVTMVRMHLTTHNCITSTPKITESTIEILQHIQEWPPNVVETQSNR